MLQPNAFHRPPQRSTPPAPPRRPACTCHVGCWLNPRRKNNVESLLACLNWRGGKLLLDGNGNGYSTVEEDADLDHHETDLAVDDAWTLGLIEMHRCATGYMVSALRYSVEVA